MNSLILHVSSKFLLPTALVFSLYLLWRGHNEPGGGFVGGLIAAAGIAVYALPRGKQSLPWLWSSTPQVIAGIGLLCAIVSGLTAVWSGEPYLTHQWIELPVFSALGTPLLFDLGVYLVVLGAVLTFLMSYLEV